jgi:hypothetical protein
MKAQNQEPVNKEKPESPSFDAVISKQVLLALGHPGDLCKVDVRRLWDNRYRVNVFVGGNIVSARVANSFFVLADAEGAIVTSNPRITRQYGAPAGGAA